MLSSFDDFPIHQATVPVAHTATADLNHYDRYFFNGYPADPGAVDGAGAGLYFGVAMGLYPNRHVVDAAFSVVQAGRQRSVLASQRAPQDRRDATQVGPIHVEVVLPLHTLRITVEAPEQGLRADLTFAARSPAIEEPHFFQRAGVRTFFDYTRLTQFGTWSGWIEIDGARTAITPDAVWGSRDRSWGVRPVGEPAPTGAPVQWPPQFFWLWAPVNFPSLSTHFDVNEFGDGRRWHEVGCLARVGGEPAEMVRAIDWRVQWRPGTRFADAFEYDLVDWNDRVHTVRLEPAYEFHMRGLGYGHPEFGHGWWKGESAVLGEELTLPVDNPCTREHVHVQALCRATYTAPDGSTEQGTGILEQLAVGDHPTGLTGILDPYVD